MLYSHQLLMVFQVEKMLRQFFLKSKQQDFFAAVYRNDYEKVKSFLSSYVIENYLNEETEYHLLKYLIEKGTDKMFSLFVNRNPDLTMSDDKGNTLLMTALYANQKNKALMLIQKGCNVEIGNVRGSHPLIVAADKGMITILSRILEKNVPVDKPGPKGMTALIRAAGNNQFDAVNFLLQKGANINQQSDSGYTALICALRYASPAVVYTLLNRNADVNKIDENGQTALFYALKRKEMYEVVPMLLKKGAYVNVVNHKGETPLMAAVESGKTAFVRLLLENGAQPAVISKSGETALSHAKRRRLPDMAALLNESLFQQNKEASAQIVKWFETDKDLLNKLRLCDSLLTIYQKMIPTDRKKVLTQIQPFLTLKELQKLTERSQS